AVRGHEQIEGTIVVDVPVGSPAPNPRCLEGQAHLSGHLPKLPFSKIAEQVRRLGVPHAPLDTLDFILDWTVQVKQVQPAVPISIEQKTPAPPATPPT